MTKISRCKNCAKLIHFDPVPRHWLNGKNRYCGNDPRKPVLVHEPGSVITEVAS